METGDNWLIFDGKMIPAERPVVPVVSRGLMYGDGVFETMRIYQGKALLLEEHITRLHSGMQMLGIEVKDDLAINTLQKKLYQLLENQQLIHDDTIVRLQVWRDGQRGYQPQDDSTIHYTITASSCPDSFSPSILATVDQRRIPSQSMPSSAKFTNGINYILAAREAADKGGDDALMQTVDGFVSETTIANIFWTKDDTIFTPDEECDLIPGITRKIVLNTIAGSKRWKCQKGKYSLDHICGADAVWVCNSVREILAVKQIDGQEFDVKHPAIEELQNQYTAYRRDNAKSLKP